MRKHESLRMIKASIPYAIILYGIFAIFGNYHFNIAIAITLGTVYANINFFMIAQATIVALTKNPLKAKNYMIINYFIRLLLTGELIYLAIKYAEGNNFITVLAFVLPLFFPKIIIILGAKKGGVFFGWR